MKKSFASAVMAAAALGGVMATEPAEAHDHGRGRHGGVEIIIGGSGVGIRAPLYGQPYYAPPPVYYTPPPVYVAPPVYQNPYGYNRDYYRGGRQGGSVIGMCEYPVKTYHHGREYISYEAKPCVIR